MNDKDANCAMSCTGMMWWLTLLVAVLAVPSAAFLLTKMFPVSGLGEVAVFVLACWLCTYLGMRLMNHPAMADKINLKK